MVLLTVASFLWVFIQRRKPGGKERVDTASATSWLGDARYINFKCPNRHARRVVQRGRAQHDPIRWWYVCTDTAARSHCFLMRFVDELDITTLTFR